MSDPLRARSLTLENSDADSPVQSCHLLLCDPYGEVFAEAAFSPAQARRIAGNMLEIADLAEARSVKQRGVLV